MPTLDELANSITPRADPPPVAPPGANEDPMQLETEQQLAAQFAKEHMRDWTDGWNSDKAPNPGPYTSAASGIAYSKGQAPVIGDPDFDWDKGAINVDIPKSEDVAPSTCWDRCKEEDKLHRANCAKLRKRVELLLKNAGCPSKIVPLKMAGGCGPCARKTAAKK